MSHPVCPRAARKRFGRRERARMIQGPLVRALGARTARGIFLVAGALWGLVLFETSSCGLKAAPVPRDSVVPVPIENLAVRVESEAVRLEFTLPVKALDGSALKEIGGYRVIRRSPRGEESRREVRFSVSEQREKVGRKIVERDPLPAEPGLYEYWVLPLDAYGSHPERGKGERLDWEGPPARPAAGL